MVGVLIYLQSSLSLCGSVKGRMLCVGLSVSFDKKAALGAGKSAVSIVARDIGRSKGGEMWFWKILFASMFEPVRSC